MATTCILAARVTKYSRSTQIRCGGKCNTLFVENFLMHVTTRNYENWSTNKKVIAKIKRVGPIVFSRNSSGDEIVKRDFSVYLFILQLCNK